MAKTQKGGDRLFVHTQLSILVVFDDLTWKLCRYHIELQKESNFCGEDII